MNNSNSDLYHQGSHPDGVRAICPECDRIVLKETETEALEVAKKHNKQQHNNEEVAGICEWDIQSASDMMETLKKNMTTEEYLSFILNLSNPS